MKKILRNFALEALSFMAASTIIFGGLGSAVYLYLHPIQLPWYTFPLGLAVGGPLAAIVVIFCKDDSKRRDMSFVDSMIAAMIVFLTWMVAGILTIGHFL